jgi:hypothetical protein
VEKDCKELGIIYWREMTSDRAEWKGTLSVAMNLIGEES